MSEEMSYDKFIKVYAKNEVVFEENSTGAEMYLVSSGKVKLYSEGKTGRHSVIATLGPGEHFGEMALIDSSPRSASAMAMQHKTRLVVLDKPKFLYLVSQQPEFAYAMMETLCQRIRDANAQLAKVKTGRGQGKKNG